MEKVVRLKAIIDEQEHDLDVRIDGGLVRAEIDGRIYDLELRQPEPGSYLFLRESEVHECQVNKAHEGFDVSLHGCNYAITIVDPKRLRSGQDTHGHQHGMVEIKAPMPGKVVKVQIERGATVEKGCGIVVVEAKKMQDEMKWSGAGVVVSINVKQGDTVNAGDVLAVVE